MYYTQEVCLSFFQSLTQCDPNAAQIKVLTSKNSYNSTDAEANCSSCLIFYVIDLGCMKEG